MPDELTIVGPVPSGGKKRSTPARFNVEALLLMAKYDPAFRGLLLSDRTGAIEQIGIDFSKSERLLLSSIPAAKLEASIDEFNLPGVSRESLPSWKEAALVIMLVMSIIVGGACAHSPSVSEPSWTIQDRESHMKCDINKINTGWCDEHTYRIIAAGAPVKKYTDPVEIKKSARDVAKINAQYMVLEKFKGAQIEGAGGAMYEENTGIALAHLVASALKTGSIIAERFADDGACEIVFEVREKWLKKKVEGSFFR